MHATICDMITDLVQNAVEAGSKNVRLELSATSDRLTVRVADDGKGMDAATLKRISDPFYTEAGKHDHRRVGLGVPLLLQTAEACGGDAKFNSTPGKGTEVDFNLDLTNVDTPPLGDLPGTVVGLMTFLGDYDLVLVRQTPKDQYQVSRKELLEALGDLTTPGSLVMARDFLRSREEALA